MKKLFYCIITVTALVACVQTQEQKAEVLIKESLKKSLYKPDTYKPVETKVDSAFSPYDDPAFFEELRKLGELNSEYDDLDEKAKRAKSSMALWIGDRNSAYGKDRYQEAEEEYNDAIAKLEKIRTKGRKQYDNVIKILRGERKFIGYIAEHNYRADNNAGNTLIGDAVFIIDKDFKEVQCSMSVEEYNHIQDAIRQIMEELEEAEE